MTPDRSTPVACSLDGRDFQQRLAWIDALNTEHLLAREQAGSALRLIYHTNVLAKVQEMVDRERECCAFLDFSITSTDQGVELTITVPERLSENAEALLAPFSRPTT